MAKTLVYRARTVVSERKDRRKELEHLREGVKVQQVSRLDSALVERGQQRRRGSEKTRTSDRNIGET